MSIDIVEKNRRNPAHEVSFPEHDGKSYLILGRQNNSRKIKVVDTQETILFDVTMPVDMRHSFYDAIMLNPFLGDVEQDIVEYTVWINRYDIDQRKLSRIGSISAGGAEMCFYLRVEFPVDQCHVFYIEDSHNAEALLQFLS